MFKVQYWELPADDKFTYLTKKFAHCAAGYVYIFDVCDMESFQNLGYWMNLLEPKDKEEVDVRAVRVLVGNKIDTDVTLRKVGTEQG